ncbi:HD domain-containing phosphohydrolase [Hwanghaeella sp.]|uniref:HD domain-containing phosphohydrolase n=1 Tax=Hwanghaeella sp. TaxID=2605943 RepID=UPI003CCB7C46
MEKILFVDDDSKLLAGIRRMFRNEFDIDCAEGGAVGLDMIGRGTHYAAVVADMRMPGMDGVEFLSSIAERYPDPTRIMLTGNNDQETAVKAVNEGHVFRFLNKPCSIDDLRETLIAAVERHRLRCLERDLMERTMAGSVKVLLDVMEVTNPIAFGRVCGLRSVAEKAADAMGAGQSWEIKIATLLSSIGWISVPDDIIQKVVLKQKLSADEQDIVERHVDVAYDLLKGVPRMGGVASTIRYQNKNFDGTGYPDDPVAGEKIPLGSRILKVLNAVTPMGPNMRPDPELCRRLSMEGEEYDPAVLVIVQDILDNESANRTGDHVEVMELDASRLLPGDVLETDLCASDGTLLLSAGHQLTHLQITKLRRHPKFKMIVDPATVSRLII